MHTYLLRAKGRGAVVSVLLSIAVIAALALAASVLAPKADAHSGEKCHAHTKIEAAHTLNARGTFTCTYYHPKIYVQACLQKFYDGRWHNYRCNDTTKITSSYALAIASYDCPGNQLYLYRAVAIGKAWTKHGDLWHYDRYVGDTFGLACEE